MPARDEEPRRLTRDQQKLLFCRCCAYFKTDNERLQKLFDAVFDEPMNYLDRSDVEPEDELRKALEAARLKVKEKEYHLLLAYIVREQKVTYSQINKFLEHLGLSRVKSDGKQVRKFAEEYRLVVFKRNTVKNAVGETKSKLTKILNETKATKK